MAKYASDTILDQALNYVKNNADKEILCAGQPANYSDATTLKSNGGNKLGETAVASGDFTLANGDTSGRKVTVAQQSGVNVDESARSGTEGYQFDHVAIVDDTASELLLVSTVTARDVTSGDSITVNAWDEEIEDPS